MSRYSRSNRMEYRAPAFCDCVFPKSTEMSSYSGDIHELVTCKCGQEDHHPMEWTWDKDSAHPECHINGADVTFHPIFSQGTSIIRGNRRLEPHMIHYWEIRIITSLSGTDVMIGIGSDKVNLTEFNFAFSSALGISDQSWGFSYRGIKHHNGQTEKYGNKFTQGCILGVYLDLCRGYLEFYINRRSLGIAYSNIPIDPNVKLYPMACSTAAKSSIRLINASSQNDSLQFHAMKIVSKRPALLSQIKDMPGFKSVLNGFWFLNLPLRYSRRSSNNDLSLEDEAVLPRRSRKSKHRGGDEYSDYDEFCNSYKLVLLETPFHGLHLDLRQ